MTGGVTYRCYHCEWTTHSFGEYLDHKCDMSLWESAQRLAVFQRANP